MHTCVASNSRACDLITWHARDAGGRNRARRDLLRQLKLVTIITGEDPLALTVKEVHPGSAGVETLNGGDVTRELCK